jgi:hypothetical protein
MAAALGLAYLTGTAVVSLLLIVTLVIGVPFTLATFLVAVLACMGIGAFRSRGQPRGHRPSVAPRSGGSWRTWQVGTWVTGAFVIVFAAYAAVGLLSASEMPLIGGDAWTIWARKAQMLTAHDSLLTGFFEGPSYGFMHPDYPLLYPVWEAIHFRAGGAFETQALLRHVWLLLITFVWAVAFLLRKEARPIVWAPLLLLAAATPGVWQQLLTGYADVPMAIFASLGAISLALWLRREEGQFLALAAILLAAAANTKNEGLMAAVALLLAAGGVGFARRLRFKQFAFASLAVVAAVLPWRVWLSVHGIEGDLPISDGLKPGYLLDRIDRVWPATRAIGHQLADQGRWLYLLPLATLMIVAALLSGIGRRIAGFYLASLALLSAGLVWSYWISPHPLGWHLSTSVGRVISVLMFLCLVAAVHLTGVMLTAFTSPDPRFKEDGVREATAVLEPLGRSD